MRLIKEVCFDTKILTESTKDGKKSLFVEGIFLQSGIKNRNGRVYPEEIMDKEVNRYIKECVDANRAMGELGHPDTPSIGLDRVSHLITSLKKEGNNWVGKAKILDTPTGNIARGLIEGGAVLGVSSRALGSLKEVNGVNVVQSDFLLSTAADLVSDPSGPNCFIQGIMESKEWIFINGKYEERDIENAKRNIKNASRYTLNETALNEFENFLNSIK